MLRPSGGRGEYELAGRQGTIHVHDLFNLPIKIEISPGVTINSFSQCVLRDGKPRIRLTQQARNAHPSSLIAAAMLLPEPRREKHETHGNTLLSRKNFVVQAIRINVVQRPFEVLICPLIVRLENGDGLQLDISFPQRMARVFHVWTAASAGNDRLSQRVRDHCRAFTSPLSTQSDYTRSYQNLHDALGKPDGDILPLVESHFGINTADAQQIISEDVDALVEDVNISPEEARVERVKRWRMAVVRGSSAALFRRNIQTAYDSRCLFTGQRLPRLDVTSSAGVDAAHILPWSRYDIDSTCNGMCLTKQCHWAFDEGILRLNFDTDENTYVISISPAVMQAAPQSGFDIGYYSNLCGRVPLANLPANRADWPSPQYLNELNAFLDSDAA